MSRVLSLAVAAFVLVAAPTFGQTPELARWAGNWQAGLHKTISITVKKTGLRLVGAASWGMSDPDRVASGGINVGDFDVTVPAGWISRNEMAFAIADGDAVPAMAAGQYDCVVRLKWKRDRLEVKDNGMCGGLNVSFSGAYQRGLRTIMFDAGAQHVAPDGSISAD